MFIQKAANTITMITTTIAMALTYETAEKSAATIPVLATAAKNSKNVAVL
jgi:hypothetical protein